MTVDQNEVSKEIKLGDGVATIFSFSFVIYESSDLVVTFTNTSSEDTVLDEGSGITDYSVSVSEYPGVGSITYPATLGVPLAIGEKLTIQRVLPLEQQTDLQNQGGYFPEVQEDQYDKLVRIDKQQQEALDRAVVGAASGFGTDYTLPFPKADALIGVWNSLGDAIVIGPTAGEIVNAELYAQQAQASAVLAELFAALSLQSANIAGALVGIVGYFFDPSTSMSVPASGYVRFNNADPNLVTKMALSSISMESGLDVSEYIKTWDDVNNALGGTTLQIRKAGEITNVHLFYVTSVTDNGNWLEATVNFFGGSGSLTLNDILIFSPSINGADGTILDPNFTDDNFRVNDDVDNSKRVAVEVSGVSPGTTRTLTIPDADITLVGTDNTQDLTNKSFYGGLR